MGIKQFKKLYSNQDKSVDSNYKLRVQKIIIILSIFIILTMSLLFPKYKVYCQNKERMIEKNNIENHFKEKMEKEDYEIETQKIQKELGGLQADIPEKVDTVEIYQLIMEIAKETEIDLKSVNFKNVKSSDIENRQIVAETELENDEKYIIGPDGRQLVYLTIEVVGSGSLENCISFLDKINNGQPLIYVKDLGIKGESSELKTISLHLLSYAMVDEQSLESIELK